MKKFLVKVLVYGLVLAMLIIPVNVLVDPYNVFHASNIRDNGIEPNKNYIKTKHAIQNKDVYDSYLFGSSRVGFIDVDVLSELTGENYYNMTYSEALPQENLESIRRLIEYGEKPKTILLGLDDISYLVDPQMHKNQLFRRSYPKRGDIEEQASFYIRYFDLYTTLKSLKLIREHKQGKNQTKFFSDYIYTNGCENLNLDITFDESSNTPYWAQYYKERTDQAISEIEEIVDLCKQHKIKLIVFTNPIHYTTYQKDVRYGYLDFLRKLADVTDYYNFSGYNAITLDSSLYYETSHYKPEVGKKITCVITGNTCDEQYYEELQRQGFGMYTTSYNVDSLITLLEHQIDSIE